MPGHELDITLQAGSQVEHMQMSEDAVEQLLNATTGNAAVYNMKVLLRELIRRSATERLANQAVTDYIAANVTESS